MKNSKGQSHENLSVMFLPVCNAPASVRIIICATITLTVMQWTKIVISFMVLQGVLGSVEEEMDRESRQFLFPFLNRLFGHGHGHGDDQPSGRCDHYILLLLS